MRDCDELRGYLVKHYKIFSKKDGYPGTMFHFITPKRMFKSLQELVDHYTGKANSSFFVCLWTLYHVIPSYNDP